MSDSGQSTGTRLNALLRAAGQAELDPATAGRFGDYCSLLQRWNGRTNLTAVRDEEGILSRHFVESIACARALPAGLSTLLDFGSGAGFPGIPIALVRPEVRTTLAESQGKKAAFLREVVRSLGLQVVVHSGRAELLEVRFDCVALRAVDRMREAVRAAAELVTRGGWLALMTTTAEAELLRGLGIEGLAWAAPIYLPGSERRMVALARVDRGPGVLTDLWGHKSEGA